MERELQEPTSLEAGDGLRFVAEDSGGRIEWGTSDWLGPVGVYLDAHAPFAAVLEPGVLWPTAHRAGRDRAGEFVALETAGDDSDRGLRLQVRAYVERPLLVFRIEATRDLDGLATRAFDQPSIAWPAAQPQQRRAGGLPDDTVAFGHAYTEFALPSHASPALEEFWLLPHGYRPAVVMPLLLIVPRERTLLLAPVNAFHEQVIAVPRGEAQRDRGVRAGWHGDLERVPAGFATELAVWGAVGPRQALDAWGADLKERYATKRPSRYADAAVSKVSYWTDNGAAYWYRTHEGCDVAETLSRAVESVEAAVPIGSLELDSWFYPHEILRRIGDQGPDQVPPTGALLWEPRDDALPDGIPALHRRLGSRPLILHARHFSSQSPYFERHAAWIDKDRAHPQHAALYERLWAQAASWGAIQVEHDWLIECYLGVRGLRAEPGRARSWQLGLDRAASEQGLHLGWCMASPADFMQTVELDRIAFIRTSGDYLYGMSSASLWCWFLLNNALARSLGLWPFKDVFLSSAEGSALHYEGDPHAEIEALLSALSAGPVGLGDRIGRTDAARVRRTCRADGVLVKPDRPIAAIDACFRAHPHRSPTPLVGETFSRHPAGLWSYLALIHAWKETAPIEVDLGWNELGEAAPEGRFVVYDWRAGTVDAAPGSNLSVQLAHADWQLRVLCPVLPGDRTLVGDPACFASVGDRRIASVRVGEGGRLECEVLGAPGERVTIRGWSAGPVGAVHVGGPGELREAPFERDSATGVVDLDLEIPSRGWLHLEIR